MLSGNFGLLDINQALNNVQAHDHLCLIYREKSERDNVLVPFVNTGLMHNERFLYLGAEQELNIIRKSLKNGGIDCENYERSDRIILVNNAFMYRNSDIDTDVMFEYLREQTALALKDGYHALRISDDMNWLNRIKREEEDLLRFVARLDKDLCSIYPLILMSQFNQKQFNARDIEMALMTHPVVIRDEHVYLNKYYIPPQVILSQKKDDYHIEQLFRSMERERLYGDQISFLADVLERSSQPFVASAADGYIITCNPAFCELSGYSLNELRNMKWNWDLNPPAQSEAIMESTWKLYNTGQPQHFERGYQRKDGSLVPAEEFVHQVCDNEGKVKYYCSFITDVTKIKEKERALSSSEARYRTLFEAIHEGFCLGEILCDEEDKPSDIRLLEINRAFEELSGFNREDIIGRNGSEIFPYVYKELISIFGHVPFTGQSITQDYYVQKLGKHYELIVFSPARGKFAALTFDISKTKELEKELQEQIHFLQNFIDSIPTAAFYRDKEGIFRFCNKAFQEALGKSSKEIVGQSLYKVLPKDLADKYREMDLTLLSTSGIQCYDWEFQYADGTRHDVIFNKAPLANSSGDFIGVVGTLVDITQRILVENALRLSEEKFRSTFSQSPIGIALYNPDGCLIDMNKACLDIFGVDYVSEIVGFDLFGITQLLLESSNSLLNGELIHFERCFDYENIRNTYSLNTQKTGTCYLNCLINPLNSCEGDTDGYLVQVQDISEQKKAEDAIKKGEANLRRITGNMMDMISQVNAEGVFEYVSPSHKTILGFQPEELLNESFFNYVHPEDYNRVKKVFNLAFNSHSFGKTDFRYCCKDGSYLYLETVGKILCDDEGKIIGAVISSRDITEGKQMEKEIARLDRLRAVGEMAASLGHEIRNPMTTVRGFLQVLGDKDGCRPYKEYFDLMVEELDAANAIISEFLSLAKDKAVYFTKQDLNQIVRAIHPLLAADGIKSDKQVILELEEIPEVLVDPKEIRQLILNLARNGLESMDEGGILTIRTESQEEEVILSVEDQGHGIEPEVLDKLGTPFFTTKEQGTGLGLAICYSICARHNAVVNVNTDSSGSKFAIVFKCEKEIKEEGA